MILSVLTTFLSHSQIHIYIIIVPIHLFSGDQNLQQKQSLLDEEDLDVKIDTMGQSPTPVKNSDEHSQSINGNVDVNNTSDNEKKER